MSDFAPRTERLAARARADVASFEPPQDPPDEDRALAYLRDGVGDVVSVYVEARTGEFVRLDEAELADLHRALNDWLGLYARCHGTSVDPDATVRTAADLVLKTHSLRDTAQLLTHVPARGDGPGTRAPWSHGTD
jgi:hypothetical protein